MTQREKILQELWGRMSEVGGVVYTARNPKAPPKASDFPAIQIFELEDVIVKLDMRGGYPVYRRRLKVVIEPFIEASSESSTTKELGDFIEDVKRKLYEGGASLGGLCSFKEEEASRVLRPPAGDYVSGISISLAIDYIEDTQTLFT